MVPVSGFDILHVVCKVKHMKTGRPTKYSEEVLEKAKEYLETYESSAPVPSIVGLCLHLDVSRKTIYNWASDGVHEEFLHILDRCQDLQHRELLKGGLLGDFNSNITKMMLTKHGYSDKQEIDHTTKGEAVSGLAVRFVEPEEDA